MHPTPLTIAALSVVALPWFVTASPAQDAAPDAITPERIAACAEDRRAEGCATILVRVLVCEQAPGLPGCEEINAMVEEADLEAEDLEPEVEPQAEGELTDEAEDDENADVDEEHENLEDEDDADDEDDEDAADAD